MINNNSITILIGRLTKDTEVFKKDKLQWANYSLAVYMGKDSKGEPQSYFIDCFQFISDKMLDYTPKKGELIQVIGSLRIKKVKYIAKDGTEKETMQTSVLVENFVKLEHKDVKKDDKKESDGSLPF